MSARSARRILWLGSLLMAPVPVLLFGPGLVPPARLLMLGGLGAAVMVFESARGAAGPLTAVLLVQGLVWAGLLWVAAWAVARPLARLSPGTAAAIAWLALAAGLVAASVLDVYHTPFAAEAARGNLLHVYR
jgi:hypothetical protein